MGSSSKLSSCSSGKTFIAPQAKSTAHSTRTDGDQPLSDIEDGGIYEEHEEIGHKKNDERVHKKWLKKWDEEDKAAEAAKKAKEGKKANR